jgi:hypothetical protein
VWSVDRIGQQVPQNAAEQDEIAQNPGLGRTDSNVDASLSGCLRALARKPKSRDPTATDGELQRVRTVVKLQSGQQPIELVDKSVGGELTQSRHACSEAVRALDPQERMAALSDLQRLAKVVTDLPRSAKRGFPPFRGSIFQE